MAITRRNFLEIAGSAGLLGALAACDTATPETPATEGGSEAAPATEPEGEPEPEAEPEPEGGSGHDLSEYPLDPDGDDVEPLWTSEELKRDGFIKVTNEGGATIGVADEARIIQVDGFAFRDMNGNGKLDAYEDWRLDADTRADDLAAQMDIHYALRQLNSGGWYSGLEQIEDEDNPVPANQRANIDAGYTNRIYMSFSQDPSSYVPDFNAMQAYAENTEYGVPVVYECETMNVGGISFPQNNTLAASFKPQNAIDTGRAISCILRGAYGATKANSPQSDVGTEPTWDRNSGTFCGDPALARDMANGYISGMQSTWSDDGSEDLGWGRESMCCNMKHFPGDGAAQYGRNSHGWDGAFDVYPNRNFKANWVPFIDGGLHLDSKTEQVASFMPFYSIAYTEDEEYGDNVAGGFSTYIMNVGRAYGFKGTYSSDWGIVQQRPWGVWDLTYGQRVAKTFMAGMNLLVDDYEYDYIDEAYDIMCDEMGKDEADAMIRERLHPIHRNIFLMGIFDWPYLERDRAKELYDNPEWKERAKECCIEGIVMLKNKGGIIKEGGLPKGAKVYVPAGGGGMNWMAFFGGSVEEEDDSKVQLPFADELLADYDVVTDTKDADGNTVDATADDLKGVEYAIITVNGPNQPQIGGQMMGCNETDENGNSTFYPRTLQYREFTADESVGVEKESIAGCAVNDIEMDSVTTVTENWSPYGQSITSSNESELDKVIRIKNDLPADAKLILCVSAGQPAMCFHELEPYGDVIFWAQQNTNDYFMELINGTHEPFGLMPWNLPKDMKAVYTQATDTPRDEECYTDSEGNTYEFAFGMNWSGVIDDERVAKYKVDPILEPESEIVEEGLI